LNCLFIQHLSLYNFHRTYVRDVRVLLSAAA
jgi:hypothetical protein